MKQIQHLYAEGFDKDKLRLYRRIIVTNIIDFAELLVEEMDRRGVRVTGSPVHPASEATTVRVRGGDLLITDGPYTETKEQIGGFDIIDCKDLDEAIEVASKHPMARYGMLDIRALYDV